MQDEHLCHSVPLTCILTLLSLLICANWTMWQPLSLRYYVFLLKDLIEYIYSMEDKNIDILLINFLLL